MKSNDIPVTDLELDQFYGHKADPVCFYTQNAISAIRMIPEYAMSPENAAAIIAAISCRIAHSGFAHQQSHWVDAVGAVEHLDDAHDLLENT